MSRQKSPVNPLTVIIIIISILLIGGLVRNAISLRQARQRLQDTKARVAALEVKKVEIDKQAAAQTDEAALDQAIRNKLNLAKPGETVVVITGTDAASLTPPAIGTAPSPEPPIGQWWQVLNPSKP